MLAPCAYVYIIHFRYSLGKDFFENFLYFRNSRPPVAPPAGSVPSDRAKVASGGLLLLHYIKLSSITKKECASAKPRTLLLLHL